MPTANNFWATTPGNGDGKIDSTSANVSNFNAVELLTAWQQLSLAGFVSGQYNATPNNSVVSGVNVPSTINKAGITFYPFSGFITMSSYNYAMEVGTNNSAYTGYLGYNLNGFLSPSDAYAIDRKLDDGNAVVGSVETGPQPYNCISYNSTYASSGYYSLYNSNANSCSLIFLFGDNFSGPNL